MKHMVENDFEEDFNRGTEQRKPILPNENDQTGPMDGIFRLYKQRIFSNQIFWHQGVILNHWSHQLKIEDILTLGQRAFRSGHLNA